MPALKPTEFLGEIIWLGYVPEGEGLASRALERMELDFDGIIGDRHAGRLRPACSRVAAQHDAGTMIANTRQISLLSAEELAETAFAMRIPELDPAWVGASVVLRGLPDLSHLPPSSRLQGPDGTTLVVDMENRPCVLPGREIEKHQPGAGARYKPAASSRRGVTAWVERPGLLELGQMLRLHIPDQRLWKPLERGLV